MNAIDAIAAVPWWHWGVALAVLGAPFCLGFLNAFDSRKNDNSTRITTTSDSYNVTSSWSQGLSDFGNTTVNLGPKDPVQALVPLLVLAVVGFVLVGLFRRR